MPTESERAPSKGPLFELRPALPKAAKVVIVIGVAVGGVGLMAGVASFDLVSLVGILGFALAIWFWARGRRVRVAAYPDRLEITNSFAELTIHRHEIAGFQVLVSALADALRANTSRRPTVHLVKIDGSIVPLQATSTHHLGDSRATDDAHARLSDWLESTGR